MPTFKCECRSALVSRMCRPGSCTNTFYHKRCNLRRTPWSTGWPMTVIARRCLHSYGSLHFHSRSRRDNPAPSTGSFMVHATVTEAVRTVSELMSVLRRELLALASNQSPIRFTLDPRFDSSGKAGPGAKMNAKCDIPSLRFRIVPPFTFATTPALGT